MYTPIIAARIGDPFLTYALRSIAEQTVPPTRILVVCNPGERLPRAWVSAAEGSADGVEVLRAERPGMIAAINHGIASAHTPYLAFLDADDLWLPQKQERQLATLDVSPVLHAVTCRAANVHDGSDGSRVVGRLRPARMFTCTTFRARTFEDFGLVDETATHFTWLYRWWAQAHDRGIRTRAIDYVGLHRRLHAGNSWTQSRRDAHEDLLAELREITHRRRG